MVVVVSKMGGGDGRLTGDVDDVWPLLLVLMAWLLLDVAAVAAACADRGGVGRRKMEDRLFVFTFAFVLSLLLPLLLVEGYGRDWC